MLATLTGFHRLAIDEAEADLLANGIGNVLAFYDVPDVAPETLAWVGLGQALFTVYGTRIIAANAERKRTAPRPAPSADNSTARTAHDPQRETAPPALQMQTIIQPDGTVIEVPAPGGAG